VGDDVRLVLQVADLGDQLAVEVPVAWLSNMSKNFSSFGIRLKPMGSSGNGGWRRWDYSN
jgi:Tfp pilus assembly protein PilZ